MFFVAAELALSQDVHELHGMLLEVKVPVRREKTAAAEVIAG